MCWLRRGRGFRWGDVSDGQVWRRVVAVRGGQKGKRCDGSCKGAKGQMLGGVMFSGIFMQFQFRFRKRLGHTLAWQHFCFTHLIKAETLSKLFARRETKTVEIKSISF